MRQVLLMQLELHPWNEVRSNAASKVEQRDSRLVNLVGPHASKGHMPSTSNSSASCWKQHPESLAVLIDRIPYLLMQVDPFPVLEGALWSWNLKM